MIKNCHNAISYGIIFVVFNAHPFILVSNHSVKATLGATLCKQNGRSTDKAKYLILSLYLIAEPISLLSACRRSIFALIPWQVRARIDSISRGNAFYTNEREKYI